MHFFAICRLMKKSHSVHSFGSWRKNWRAKNSLMPQTDPRHVLVAVAQILKKLKIPYIISGGIAVLVWGRPRFTADIDIVVELTRTDIDKLERSLKSLHAAGYIDKDAMLEALEKNGEFNFIDGESGMKVDFWIMQDSLFDKSRLKRKKLKTVLGEKVYLSSPEDLILIKTKWYKSHHSSRQKEDIESIWSLSHKILNTQYLKNMAKNLGVLNTLSGILPEIR